MRKIVRVPGSSPYGFRLVGGDGAVVTVARVRKESKAEAAGLQEGDAVLVINDVSCHGLSYNSVFGLTELNDHELKLEILRGVDAQSNWRTALACLDDSVQKLNEEEVFALLRNKNKQEFGSFQSLNQHAFQLQDPKPKFKQFSLPIIDVVLDSSDTQANFVTKPEIRGNQTTIHVVRESRQPLFHQEHERSFISRTSQDFQEKQNIALDVIHAQTDQPIKFEFQADSYKPFNFGTASKQFSENVERKFVDVTPSLQSHQSSSVHDSSPNIKASFEPPQRYASTSKITITSKNTNPLTDEPRWLAQGGNVHKSWEAPPTQTNIEDVYSSSHFDKFPRNETNYFDDAPVNSWKNFDEQRKVFKVKKFNVGGPNNPPRRDEDSSMDNPLLQTTRNFNAWSSENNFQEPFSLSSDFYQSPQEQSFQVFPGSSQQSPHQLQPSPYQSYPPPSYQPHPPPSYQPHPPSSCQPHPPQPPPLPEAGIPNQQIPGSPNELNLVKYGGNQGLRENEKQALKEKIQKAKDMAHSVLSPANKNSKGQRMFLKRRANSEHWVIEGPDPVAKQMVEQTTQNQNRAPFKPFPSFNTNQSFNPMNLSFNPERQFYQSESLSYSTPVQKWSPFGSTPQVTLGYCDL